MVTKFFLLDAVRFLSLSFWFFNNFTIVCFVGLFGLNNGLIYLASWTGSPVSLQVRKILNHHHYYYYFNFFWHHFSSPYGILIILILALSMVFHRSSCRHFSVFSFFFLVFLLLFYIEVSILVHWLFWFSFYFYFNAFYCIFSFNSLNFLL